MQDREVIAEALRLLGKRSFVLAIHDASFPGTPDEDFGRGASTSRCASGFLSFARDLGFTGIQLGPQGRTRASNASPYDAAVLARSEWNLDLNALVAEGLLLEATRDAIVAARPDGALERSDPNAADRAIAVVLDEAQRNHLQDPSKLGPRLAAFRAAHDAWLVKDALYEVLCAVHDRPFYGDWPDALDRRLYAPLPGHEPRALARRQWLIEHHAVQIERFAIGQLLAHEAHGRLREQCRQLGLSLYGDLQVGLSVENLWAEQAILLERHRMGAPPSRTNPEGQPWGYAVLDPARYAGASGGLGPALAFLLLRVDKMLAEYDGLRIDHPHGLCDPWVYDATEADPLKAVQSGARLFSSPDVEAHEALASYAIARPEQLDRSKERYADGWVRELEEAQVSRYAVVLDLVVEAAKHNGRQRDDLVLEVLSTLPYPLERVMKRYGLGRFRVTQKASVTDANDVYRAENAEPADWIMIGNHDTKPLWLLLDEWRTSNVRASRSAILAARLSVDEALLAADDGAFATAMLAELFASPAAHVLVFFADLFGYKDMYNRPGVVSEDNWRLRVEPGYRAGYDERRLAGRALDVPKALVLALRAAGHQGPLLEALTRISRGRSG